MPVLGPAAPASSATAYATLADLKARLTISDTVDDTILTAALYAASRQIDHYTDRRFFTTVADETRYFTATCGRVWTGDVTAVTSVATDDGARTYPTVWDATDWELHPFNAAADGEPYTSLVTAPSGARSFTAGYQRAVKIIGRFGYIPDGGVPPDEIHEACLLIAGRLFKRKDAPWGVTGGDVVEPIRFTRMDADVRMMLDHFRVLALA